MQTYSINISVFNIEFMDITKVYALRSRAVQADVRQDVVLLTIFCRSRQKKTKKQKQKTNTILSRYRDLRTLNPEN